MKLRLCLSVIFLSCLGIAPVYAQQAVLLSDMPASPPPGVHSTLWNGDVVISPYDLVGRPSGAAQSDGTIYVAVPDTNVATNRCLNVYRSIDKGATWIPDRGIMGRAVFHKCKAVLGTGDSVILFAQYGSRLLIWNLKTLTAYVFDSTDVRDFDVCVSRTGALYLYIDYVTDNRIQRFPSTNNGRTWSSPSLVTSAGAYPRIYASAISDTLILNYLSGPFSADTLTAPISQLRYRESSPGTISSIGTLQMVSGTDVKREYLSVIYGSKVWFFYSAGLQGGIVIKCRVSTDAGATYDTAFQVANLNAFDQYWMDAKHYNGGVDLVYFADSLSPRLNNSTDKIIYQWASATTPKQFTYQQQISEHPPAWSPANYIPSLIEIPVGGYDAGIIWVGHDGDQPRLYYDRYGAPSVKMESPDHHTTLFVGTTYSIRWSYSGYLDSVRIEYSTDAGSSWLLVHPGLPVYMGRYDWVVSATPTTQGLVRVTWIDSSAITDQSDELFDIVNSQPGNWTKGLSGAGMISSLAMSPVNEYYIYAASASQGVFRSTSAGSTWTQVNNGLLNTNIRTVAISPANPTLVYCGTAPSGSNTGVYRTGNGGTLWTNVSTGITEIPIGIEAMAVSPTNWNTVYAAVFNGVTNATSGLYKTTDGGTNWVPTFNEIVANKNFLSIVINPLNPNTIYAGTSFMIGGTDQGHVYKSMNAGGTWVEVSNGLPAGPNTYAVRTLTMDAADTNLVLAGLYMTGDLGGPYLTTNGGGSWTRIAGGLPTTLGSHPRAVVIRPNSTTEFYVGLDRGGNSTAGVFRTTDRGQSWTMFSGGELPDTTSVRSLLFAEYYMRMYAAGSSAVDTNGQGVYRNLFVPVGVEIQKQELPMEFALMQNYPNPFNPTTKIQFTIVNRQLTIVKVYDALGSEVATIVNEVKEPGSYAVQFNGSNLASGVYFYRLQSGTHVATKKMILLR